MVYVIADSTKNRIRINGELTPTFEYPTQAERYIEKYLPGSFSAHAHRIVKKQKQKPVTEFMY